MSDVFMTGFHGNYVASALTAKREITSGIDRLKEWKGNNLGGFYWEQTSAVHCLYICVRYVYEGKKLIEIKQKNKWIYWKPGNIMDYNRKMRAWKVIWLSLNMGN